MAPLASFAFLAWTLTWAGGLQPGCAQATSRIGSCSTGNHDDCLLGKTHTPTLIQFASRFVPNGLELSLPANSSAQPRLVDASVRLASASKTANLVPGKDAGTQGQSSSRTPLSHTAHWYIFMGILYSGFLGFSYLAHWTSEVRGVQCDEPQESTKSAGMLAALMFIHASLAYSDQGTMNLTDWVPVQFSLVIALFGWSARIGVVPLLLTQVITFVACMAFVRLDGNEDLFAAAEIMAVQGPASTVLPPKLAAAAAPLSNWCAPGFGNPVPNVLAALIVCESVRPVFDPLPPWISQRGLFALGGVLFLLRAFIDSELWPTGIDPLVSIFVHARVPEYLLGRSVALSHRANPGLGAILLTLLVVAFAKIPASIMDHWFFGWHAHLTGELARSIAVLVATLIFLPLLSALENPADYLGRAVKSASCSCFSTPVSAWALLPVGRALAHHFGITGAATRPGVNAAWFVLPAGLLLLGGTMDNILKLALDGLNSRLRLPQKTPGNPSAQQERRAPKAFQSPLDSPALTLLYYSLLASCILFFVLWMSYQPQKIILSGRYGHGGYGHGGYDQSCLYVLIELCILTAMPGTLVSLITQIFYPAHIRKQTPPIGDACEDNVEDDDFVMYFRYVTRGNNPNLIEENCRRSLQVLEAANLPTMNAETSDRNGDNRRWRLQVVTDRSMELEMRTGGLPIEEIVVPSEYKCPGGAKFKARALHWAISRGPGGNPASTRAQDWVIHLDEETQFDVRCALACYRHCARETAEVKAGNKKFPNIGQGCIVYNTYGRDIENVWTALVDCLRVSDDFGKFRMTWILERPFFGMHGSFVVAPQVVEEEVGFDHGLRGSITEDSYFALVAWSQIDLRISWIDGYMFEQSPFSVMDLVKQRARWLHGISLCVRAPEIYAYHKVVLVILWAAWTAAILVMMSQFAVCFLGMGAPTLKYLYALISGSQLWFYTLGYMLSYNPREVGVARWILLLLCLHVCGVFFACIECAGVGYGIYLYMTDAQEFHIVQKEKQSAGSSKHGDLPTSRIDDTTKMHNSDCILLEAKDSR